MLAPHRLHAGPDIARAGPAGRAHLTVAAIRPPRPAPRRSGRTLERLPRWDSIARYLKDQKGMASVPPGIAEQLVKRDGFVVVDVRPKESYEAAHIEGSVNVPVFQKIDPLRVRPSSILRALALYLNGVTATEANLAFVEEVEAIAGPSGKVILTCEGGGTLEPDPGFPWGKESRSLKAAFKLLINAEGQLGAIQHLDGGITAWTRRGLPMVGQAGKAAAGRAPGPAKKGGK